MTPLLWGIAAFMIVQFAIGVVVSRRITTEDDYLVAGRRMGPILVTGSIFATWFGAETVLGGAGSAYVDGVTLASPEPFAYGLCIILAGLVFAAPLWRRRLVTLADLYRQRYSPLVERVAAVVLIPTSVLWAAAQIRAFGQVLVVSGSGLELEVALAVACGFVIAYTAVGGLLADAATDVFQAVLLTVGLVVLLVAIVEANASGTAVTEAGAAWDRVQLLPDAGLPFWETLEAWAIPVLGSLAATELISRMIGARSASIARNSALGAGGIYILVGMIAVAIGVAGRGLVPPVSDPEQIVPTLARAILAPWAYVVFGGGFISAILSTVDSTLLVSAGLLSHNLVIPALGPVSERTKLRINRTAVALFGVLAYLIARSADGISAIVALASAFGSAGVLVTVTFGLFTGFGGPAAALTTLVTGIVSFGAASLLGAATPFLISLASSLAAYVAVAALIERRSGPLQHRPADARINIDPSPPRKHAAHSPTMPLMTAARHLMFVVPLLAAPLIAGAQQPVRPTMTIEEYDPRSTLEVPEHIVTRAKFPFIDVHGHQQTLSAERAAQLVKEMDELNMGLMVNLSGGTGEALVARSAALKGRYPARFVTFANMNLREVNRPDFGTWAAAELERDVKVGGAQGLKVFKDLGMDLRDAAGRRIPVDDPRFDAVWAKAGALGIPVLIHTAEPAEFFKPIDKHNERWLELVLNPRRARPPDRYPPFDSLMAEQHRVFRKHAKTTFINAHLGWYGADLGHLGALMDSLPNMMTELGAVIYELGRQPRAARAFFTKYQDRILMGKDSYRKTEYHTYFRVFETADEYFPYYRKYHAFWRMYGLELPDEILKKVYYRNAIRVIPGIDATRFPR